MARRRAAVASAGGGGCWRVLDALQAGAALAGSLRLSQRWRRAVVVAAAVVERSTKHAARAARRRLRACVDARGRDVGQRANGHPGRLAPFR